MPIFYKKCFSYLHTKQLYIAWFAASIFYFYQYILRISPGIMMDDIRLAFAIKAEDYGSLSFIYLLAYSILQVPLGMIIDIIGVRKVMLTSIAMCAISSFYFGNTTIFWCLQVLRFLMGISSATAFMCALKIVADNFKPGHRGFLMGATLAFGTLGALFTSNVLILIIGTHGWRDVWYFTSIAGIIVFFLAYFAVKDKSIYSSYNNKQTAIEHSAFNLKLICLNVYCTLQDQKIILYSVLTISLYTPLSALADVWGAAFIKQKLHLTSINAAHITSILYLGLSLGSVTLPWLCEKFSILNKGIIYCNFIILISLSLLLYWPGSNSPFSHALAIILLFVIGFACGGEMICFTAAVRLSKPNNSGEVLAIVNSLNMLGGGVLHYIIGMLLDANWDGILDTNNLRIYSVQNFTYALSILTLTMIICSLLSLKLDRKQ